MTKMTRKQRYPLVKKQPRSAYSFYYKDMATKIEDKKNLRALVISGWKTTKNTDDLKQYLDMAANDRDRYWKEVEETYGADALPKIKVKRKITPYIRFSMQHTKQIQQELGVTYKEAVKETGLRWKALTLEEKEQYN